MLSICIPTYNDDCSKLVLALKEQIACLEHSIEILIYDDASTNKKTLENNRALTISHNFIFIENKTNVGRLNARLNLAQKARYEWLLFLDADVLPRRSNFLQSYISQIHRNPDVMFGGLCYKDTLGEEAYRLHWTYGKDREERSLKTRIENPIQSLVSANIAIKKKIFLKIDDSKSSAVYGRDEIILAHLLKQHKNEVLHIDNPVVHLGLERAPVFLSKQLDAVKALSFQYKQVKFQENDRPLIKAYLKLKPLKLHYLYFYALKPFVSRIKNNLLGNAPNLKLLDCYKLYHFIKWTDL